VPVSFDLFGTLVAVDRPGDPAAAVADELRARGVAVPADFAAAYRERHVDAPDGAEVPLPAHVAAALRSRGVSAADNAVRRAVVAAFDPTVRTREGAADAVAAARARGPVGLLSNCSVPELVARTLVRADLPRDGFDSVVTSVACGWRKPHARAFAAVADGLGVDPAALVHVGDSPATDGGVEAVGGTFVDAREVPLPTLPAWLDARAAGEGRGGAEAADARDGEDGCP
jgi:FMN phosphatase YigB (HAD superfamily)